MHCRVAGSRRPRPAYGDKRVSARPYPHDRIHPRAGAQADERYGDIPIAPIAPVVRRPRRAYGIATSDRSCESRATLPFTLSTCRDRPLPLWTSRGPDVLPPRRWAARLSQARRAFG